jgi:DNA-binding CsgD family transcriptional regulator
VLGVAFLLAWVLSVLSNPLLFKAVSKTLAPIAAQEIFIVASLVIVSAVWTASHFKRFTKRTVALLTVISALSPIAALFDTLGADIDLILVFWALSGFGTMTLLMFWGFYFSTLEHHRAVLYPALSFAFMAMLVVLTGLFAEPVATIVMILFPLISLSMLYLERMTRSSAEAIPLHQEYPAPHRKPFPERNSLFRPALRTFRNNLCFGFALSYFFLLTTHSSSFVFGVVVFAVCVVRILDLFFREFIDIESIARIIMPLAAVTILPLSFANATVSFVLCCVILAYSVLADMTNWSAVSEKAQSNKIEALTIFCSDRMGNLAGLGIGMLIASFAFGTGLPESADGSFLPSLVVIILACIYPIVFNDDTSAQIAVDTAQPQDEDDQDRTRYGSWRQKCMKFAEHYHLSPRQQEVMLLLAKGRDANYIEENLVISGHTAKAHIYNIYSKTNVHSHQELINLIEAFEVSDRDD